MTLVPEAMAAEMVLRATQQGLIDQPPHFALSRTMAVLARAAVTTILSPTGTVLFTSYGPGQPALGFGTAGPVIGLDGLNPDRFAQAVQAAAGFVGPYAGAFFQGVAGIVSHLATFATFLDLLVPTGNGTGLLSPGGIVLDSDTFFDEAKDEAVDEEIMVVQLGVHIEDPLQQVLDPTTQLPLGQDDFFSQAENLVRACGTQLAAELLFATKTAIPVSGAFNPLAPAITATTVTARLL